MHIVLMEPLGISSELLRQLSDPLISRGHTVQAYDSFTLDTQELITADAEVMIIANHALPRAVIEAAPKLQMLPWLCGCGSRRSRGLRGAWRKDFQHRRLPQRRSGRTGGGAGPWTACGALPLVTKRSRAAGYKGLQGHELAGSEPWESWAPAPSVAVRRRYSGHRVSRLVGYSRTQRQAARDLDLNIFPG